MGCDRGVGKCRKLISTLNLVKEMEEGIAKPAFSRQETLGADEDVQLVTPRTRSRFSGVALFSRYGFSPQKLSFVPVASFAVAHASWPMYAPIE